MAELGLEPRWSDNKICALNSHSVLSSQKSDRCYKKSRGALVLTEQVGPALELEERERKIDGKDLLIQNMFIEPHLCPKTWGRI